MKPLKPFQLTYPLVSTYVADGGIGAVHNGALLITGNYHYAGKEIVIDDAHYELAPGTTLNNLMEWLLYNTDAQITEAVMKHIPPDSLNGEENIRS